MINSIMKLVDVASKNIEKLSAPISGEKEKLFDLDKPLNKEGVDYLENRGEKTLLDKLDTPLNEIGLKYDEFGFRELLAEEKQELQEKTGWSDKAIDGCKVSQDGIIRYPCRNEALAGSTNPFTGVMYERRVEEYCGFKVEVVVPKFEAVFDVKLPDEMCEAKDREQFKECNRQLYGEIQQNEELAKMFTPEQIEQIKDGITNGGAPEGYTWHHDSGKGQMQLVDSDMHADSRHTGGKTLWGGGNENR